MEDKKRARLIEAGKDVLIVLLTCSAVFLALHTPLAGVVREEAGGSQARPTENQMKGSMIWPARLVLSSWNGESMARFGVQYDQTISDQCFQSVASLLREALGGMERPEQVDEKVWRQALSGTSSLYFDLLGEMPLSVLSTWFSGADNGLEGTVRRLLLAREGDHVTLYYRDTEDGTYYASRAGVVTPDQLDNALQGVVDNGAAFAFELEQYSGLDGETLILTDRPRPRIYTAANPMEGEGTTDRVDRDSRLAALLQALSFPASSYTYSGVDQVILSGNDALRISGDGVVRYTAEGDRSRYLIPSQHGQPALPEIAQACRQLVSGAVEPLMGAARIYLREIRQDKEGWQLEFGYSLDGVRVELEGGGSAAQFQVRGNEITQFTIRLRSYTETDSRGVVLPEEQAMAAMEAMDRRGSELSLAYYDTGGETVTAGWTAE